jgi:DedD protein
MGLFTRNKAQGKENAAGSASRPRPSVSSEAQASELRARARRRLVGAVALVLAAVIVLPMLLDSAPKPVADDIPIRIPGRDSPYQPEVSQLSPASQPRPAVEPPAQPESPASVAPPAAAETQAPKPAASAPKPVETKPADTRAETAKPADSTAKPATPARTDDGSRALALLQGRGSAAPAPAKPQASGGSYVLQVASYSTQSDAQTRSTQLRQAGITNTSIEPATVDGKQWYRLRVGPFQSHDAAQAAQARLRALGYGAGSILPVQ